MNIYSLKGGKKFSITRYPRPREGEVVFFTQSEWDYIKAMNFTEAHRAFLWEQKFTNYRYSIVPEKGLTEPEVARKYLREILSIFETKKKAG